VRRWFPQATGMFFPFMFIGENDRGDSVQVLYFDGETAPPFE
jgi:hypothetical protein